MRIVTIAVALGLGAGWLLLRQHRAHTDHVESATAVLRDVASLSLVGELGWHSGGGGASSVGYQTERMTVELHHTTAHVAAERWRLELELAGLTEIVCDRRLIHSPEPGFFKDELQFRTGTSEDGLFPETLLMISFPDAHDAEFRRVCATHHLREEGDWGP